MNDKNDGLVAVYRAFLERPTEFINLCREILPEQPGEPEVSTKGKSETSKKYNQRLGEVFARFAADEGMDPALRYFFLNRTIWAGRVTYDEACRSRLYYSNPGGWNITKPEKGVLEDVAKHVAGTRVSKGDYSALLEAPGSHIWIYADPPYVVDTRLTRQSKLYEFGFDMSEHERFVKSCSRLDPSTHRICISYDDLKEVRDWFPAPLFHVYEHAWAYSGTTKKEKVVGKELIITNYERIESRFRVAPPLLFTPEDGA